MLLYLPTGAGKTVIATFIIKALREAAPLGRTLLVAHRREILDQTAATLRRHLPELRVCVEQGARRGDVDADITVASVQSLVRRKERYAPDSFSLIICDECHRALAPSWEQVLDYFGSCAGSETLLLGMTATPRRTDGRSVEQTFGETAFEISRTELEDLGYLVPMRYFTVQGDLRLSGVKLAGGDFQIGALSRIMDTPAHRALAVKAWLEAGKNKRTIVFCAGVKHAAHLVEDFRSLGVSADKIDGKTRDREGLLSRFQRGEVQVLTNYGVLTEGFDDPGVACILMARPTTSPLVYTQCIGRGLRCAPGKTVCTVIDLVDRSTHQLQYGATQMAGLPKHWRSRGGDPFRQAASLQGIKVTSPEAFLRLREAESLRDVQSILMSLPPSVVVAGLDGEAVPRYERAIEPCSSALAQRRAGELLKQAGALGTRVTTDEDGRLRVAFRNAEVDNERFAYLKWHIEEATGAAVEYDRRGLRPARRNPRAMLRSMLPEDCRIETLQRQGDGIRATVMGLSARDLENIAFEFQQAYGLNLDIRGQMALF